MFFVDCDVLLFFLIFICCFFVYFLFTFGAFFDRAEGLYAGGSGGAAAPPGVA